MYRLRCSVSGGLEAFVEAEVSQVIKLDARIEFVWHHKGHSGSLLDLICDQSGELFLQETLPELVQRLHFVDHVSMQVMAEEVMAEQCDSDWITDRCLQLNRETLETAKEAWALWKPLLDNVMSTHELEGELIALPEINDVEDLSGMVQKTEAFQVNTIYTKPHVARTVVDKFVKLIQKELDNNDDILWLDAGAGCGALLQHLPKDASIGVDLDPRHESVHQLDFFQVSEPWLKSCRPNYQSLCILSNPPFVQGSRGDYTIIAKFLGHAIELKARFMGLIVPQKFAHAWKCFGLPIQLRYRMHLPKDSFYDPSTAESKHVKCYLLVYDLDPTTNIRNSESITRQHDSDVPATIHVVAQRDKGLFPHLSTAEFTSAVVHGLGRGGVPLGSSKISAMTLRAKLGTQLELFLELNPKRPLSIANSISRQLESHSLGWMSKSVKPNVALAMNYLSLFGEVRTAWRDDAERLESKTGVTVNLMCGEGTLEFEAMHCQDSSTFYIVGDKNTEAVHQVKAQLSTLQQRPSPPMDFVLWDAQNLPLRRGIADSVMADLPFAGSSKKNHQEPSTKKVQPSRPSLSYPRVLAGIVRVLTPSTGRAIMVSADTKALTHAIWKFAGSLKEVWQNKLNIGGLSGRLSLVSRKNSNWKDLNLLVEDTNADHSMGVLERAREACSGFCLDELLELKGTGGSNARSLVSGVEYRNEYRHQDQTVCHCYRLHFDALVANTQAKALEKVIRQNLEEKPVLGTRLG